VKGSSRPVGTEVKGKRGWGRHLEGWQPGLLTIFVAGVSALLAVPRPVPPTDLPEPMIEPRELDRVARADEALADAAEHERLDTDVRAIGSAIIAYNLAEVAGDADAVALERRNVAEATRRALPHGDEAIARLRAHHLRSFQRELRRWESTGEATAALRELGGLFLEGAGADHWIQGHRLLADDAVRGALFKKRWNDLTLLRGTFELTAVEQRALLRFLLLHPHREAGPPRRTPPIRGLKPTEAETQRAAEQRALYQAEEYRLDKIKALAALDPAYPADLARGVVLYRLHRYPGAVEAFRLHLDAHPDGPYAMRAQNYLDAALNAARDTL
jgi:hypothetical protein